MTATLRSPAAPEPVEVLADDGTAESGSLAGTHLLVNRITPSYYPALMQAVRIQIGSFVGEPNPIGQSVRVRIFLDPAGRGEPRPSPVFVRDLTVVVSQQGFVTIPIEPLLIESGDVYIGYSATRAGTGIGVLFDDDGAPRLRAFVSDNEGDRWFTFDPPGNLMIRGVFQPDQQAGERRGP